MKQRIIYTAVHKSWNIYFAMGGNSWNQVFKNVISIKNEYFDSYVVNILNNKGKVKKGLLKNSLNVRICFINYVQTRFFSSLKNR